MGPAHTRELLQLSADVKARPGRYASTLSGKFIALIFEKPSLRTRVTFEVGIQSMGGSVVFLDHTQASASLGARDPSPMSRESRALGAGHRRARVPPTRPRRNGREREYSVSTRSRINFIPARLSRFLHPRGKFGALAASSWPTSATGNKFAIR